MHYYKKYLKYKNKYNKLKNNLIIEQVGSGYSITLKRTKDGLILDDEIFTVNDFSLDSLKDSIANHSKNITTETHEITILNNGQIIDTDDKLIKICFSGTCKGIYFIKEKKKY